MLPEFRKVLRKRGLAYADSVSEALDGQLRSHEEGKNMETFFIRQRG